MRVCKEKIRKGGRVQARSLLARPPSCLAQAPNMYVMCTRLTRDCCVLNIGVGSRSQPYFMSASRPMHVSHVLCLSLTSHTSTCLSRPVSVSPRWASIGTRLTCVHVCEGEEKCKRVNESVVCMSCTCVSVYCVSTSKRVWVYTCIV